jgi:hypothetical protein
VHNPNPEEKLCDIPVSMAVVMSPCENITSMLLAPANGDIKTTTTTILMDYGISGNKNEMNTPETAVLNDDRSTSDDEEHKTMEFCYEKTGTHQFVPTIAEAEATFGDIKKILKPPCRKGTGYDHHGLDELMHSCIEAMQQFLWKYITGNNTGRWILASLETAQDHKCGPYHAHLLQEWTLTFIADQEDLPRNVYRT